MCGIALVAAHDPDTSRCVLQCGRYRPAGRQVVCSVVDAGPGDTAAPPTAGIGSWPNA